MDFGKTLKNTRESKELTLQQIARELKINLNVLKKLEESKADELPNPTSTKGFIKSYALHLSIDPDPLIQDYLEKLKSETKPSDDTVLKGTIDPKPFFLSEFIQKKIIPLFVLLVLVVLGAVAYRYLNGADTFLNQITSENEELKDTREIVKKQKEAQEALTASNSTTSSPSTGSEQEGNLILKQQREEKEKKEREEADAKKHKLIIEPLDKTYAYYKAKKDDHFITLTLKPNVRRTFTFKEAEIKFLDAGAVSLIFDGKDLGSPGIFAEEKTIEFPSLEGL